MPTREANAIATVFAGDAATFTPVPAETQPHSPASHPNPQCTLMNDPADIAAAVKQNACDLLIAPPDGKPLRVPTPQDWVLVLERVKP